MATLISNVTDYVNDDDIGVGFVASVLAIVVGGSFFFMYNLLIIPDADTVRAEKETSSEARKVPIPPPAPLKPVSGPTL
jgi:uncharacterized membrane-anchored protein